MNYLLIVIFIFTNITLVIFGQSAKETVTGFVKDAKTNSSILEAVIFANDDIVAHTDSSGFFKFSLTSGEYKISSRRIDYQSSDKEIIIEKSDDKKELIFYLIPKPVEIEKVTITGERYKELEDFKTYELLSGEMKNIPVFLESDPLRAVQALPGVTSPHDLSSLIYLRGGNFDETQISLDNVTVYNPYHLGGIFSSFNSDMVEREILYPSNYPVNFQGVLSGVLSIHSKEGNNEKLKGIASASLASSKLYLEGPLSKGTFAFSARRTYPDLLYNIITGGRFPYYFYDCYGKYTIPLDDKNLLSVSGFYSKDIYELFTEDDDIIIEKNEDLNWGNKVGKLSYTHFLNKADYQLEFSYSNSNLNADVIGMDTQQTHFFSIQDSLNQVDSIYASNKIEDFTIRNELNINLTGQKINIGFEYKYLSAKYNWDFREEYFSSFLNIDTEDIFFSFAPNIYKERNKSNIFSVYFSDKLQLLPSLSLTPGYRIIFIEKFNSALHSPYLLINYNLSKKISFSAAYGKYYEYFHTKRELTTQNYFYPFAAYFISDKKSQVPASEHFSFGIKIQELLPSINFEAEGYYKQRDNVFTAEELTRNVSYLSGYAGGFDLLLKKNTGRLTGWTSYSFTRSVVNGKNYNYYASYDRTHNFKVLINYDFNNNWKINSFWFYSTGLPLTPAVGKFVSGYYNENFQRGFETAYGRNNSLRYKDYHRLDIGITGHFIWGKYIAKPYFQIMNVYNSENPFNYKANPNETSVEAGAERASLIIPTIGLTVEF